ncbi:MAG: phosphopantetheine-binding protein [Myxococcota bacterium]
MENPEKLQRQIIDIFAERFETKLTDVDVDLLDTGLVDSVKIVELVLELEQRFGVSLPFEDLEIEDFRTIAKLAECITRTAPVAA